jgi:hypothetical protein
MGYLRGELARGRPVLLTGAGFSCDARDLDGRPVPTGREMADELWPLCFPGEPRDEASTLQDLYQAALHRCPDDLARLLERRLSIDAATLPAHYRTWFSMPWRRVYTLNVDDVERAAARRFELPRRIVAVSALRPGGRDPAARSPPGELEVVHLNGIADDGADRVTFATTQYGRRIAGSDPWYARLVADLLELPVVLVGTRLDESPFWQNLEHVRPDGSSPRRRPRSFLVAPHISRARQALLEDFQVTWLPLSADRFARDVLAPIADVIPLGLAALDEPHAPSP